MSADNQKVPGFSDRMSAIRTLSGLSREDFARRLGLSKNTIAHYERGERHPDVVVLRRLRDEFDVDLNILATGEPAPASQTQETPMLSKTVPIVGLADCGLGAWCTTGEMRVNANAPDDLLDPDAFAVLTTGNSMLPAGIPPGILCFCSPNTRFAAGDAVYVQRYDNTASIKIFQKRDEKWYYLLGYGLPDPDGAQKIFTERLALSAVKRIAPVIWEKRKL